MNTSERINALKEISKKLDYEEWGIIDLTLKQFGIPTTDEFQGSKFEYILNQIQHGTDKEILELASRSITHWFSTKMLRRARRRRSSVADFRT